MSAVPSEPRARSPSWARRARRAAEQAPESLVALVACGLGWAVVRACADHYEQIDDSYISFRYARNLVEGHGLVYNVGDRVEGYTNFLWTLLSAIPIALGADPMSFMRVVGIIAYTAWVALLTTSLLPQVFARGPRPLPRMLLVVLASAPAFATALLPEGLPFFAVSGLETHLVAFLLLATGLTQHVFVARTAKARAGFSVLALAMLLTRLDTALFLAASAAVVALEHRAARTTWRQAVRDLFARFAAPITLMPLYLVWKLAYYGSLMPNTYYAKAADMPHWTAGLGYLEAYLDASPYVLVLLPFALLMTAAEHGGRARAFARFAMLGLAAYLLYVARVGGDFMQYRFMFEVYPVLLWPAAAGVAYVATTSIAAALPAGVLAMALTRHEQVLELTFHMETPEDMDSCCGRTLVRLGKRFAQVLPRDTIIATTAAGSIPYFTRLTTIDQYGLTDRETAHQSTEPEAFRRGHVKYNTREHALARQVNLVFGHPETCPCDNPCVEPDLANVFVRIEGNECVRSWYATPKDELSRYFCQDKDDFVVTNFDCSPFLEEPSRVP